MGSTFSDVVAKSKTVKRTPPTIVAIEILCPVDGNFLTFFSSIFAADL